MRDLVFSCFVVLDAKVNNASEMHYFSFSWCLYYRNPK